MKRKRIAQVVLALAIIAVGVLLALDHLTRFDVWGNILSWWPVLLAALSVLWMLRSRPNYANTFLLGFSVLLLFWYKAWWLDLDGELGIATGAYALVLLGVWILIRAFRPRKWAEETPPQQPHVGYAPPQGGVPDSTPSFDYFDVLGGGTHICLSKNLIGGQVTAVLGGSTLDLSQADFTQPLTVRATAILGGIDIITPPHVRVELRGSNLLGGCDADKITGRPYDPAHPVLTVQYFTFCGGIDIK